MHFFTDYYWKVSDLRAMRKMSGLSVKCIKNRLCEWICKNLQRGNVTHWWCINPWRFYTQIALDLLRRILSVSVVFSVKDAPQTKWKNMSKLLIYFNASTMSILIIFHRGGKEHRLVSILRLWGPYFLQIHNLFDSRWSGDTQGIIVHVLLYRFIGKNNMKNRNPLKV